MLRTAVRLSSDHHMQTKTAAFGFIAKEVKHRHFCQRSYLQRPERHQET